MGEKDLPRSIGGEQKRNTQSAELSGRPLSGELAPKATGGKNEEIHNFKNQGAAKEWGH